MVCSGEAAVCQETREETQRKDKNDNKAKCPTLQTTSPHSRLNGGYLILILTRCFCGIAWPKETEAIVTPPLVLYLTVCPNVSRSTNWRRLWVLSPWHYPFGQGQYVYCRLTPTLFCCISSFSFFFHDAIIVTPTEFQRSTRLTLKLQSNQTSLLALVEISIK